MGIRNLSKDVLLVKLPSKSPKIANELKAVNGTVSKNGSCNMLQNSDHRLIFCNVATVTKCIFVVAGLNEVFEFADDQSKAMATVG